MIWFNLVWFDGVSAIVGYIMPNSFLYVQTVLFQIIHFGIVHIILFTHS